MNLEKVVFSFFMILALTLNFGFFIGEVDNPGKPFAISQLVGDAAHVDQHREY